MSANASVRLCKRESLRDSGSPPLRMISWSEGSHAISSRAAVHRGASLPVRKLAPETVSAVNCARLGRDQQCSARVLLQQTGCSQRGALADGVGRELGRVVGLRSVGRTCSSSGSWGSPGRIRRT